MNENIELKILNNMINTDRLFHSYLFVISNENDILRINNFINAIDNNKNSVDITRIGNDLDLSKKVIESIKKELIKKDKNNNKRIFVIEHAELLNKYSSNMLLKFIEEPVDDLIIILVTYDENKILETIKSRTMIFNLKLNYIENKENENYNEFYDKISLDITNGYAESNKFLKEHINDKLELKSFLNYGIIHYYNLYFNSNLEKLKLILNIFNKVLEMTNTNVSNNFIITKLLLELEEINYEYC